jgi:hypothetical protein
LVSQNILIISTTSLVVQLIVLTLLIFAYLLKRAKKYRQHGITTTTAVALHLITILSWMVWSFLAIFPVDFGSILHIITLAHVTLGVIAATLGVWLVSSWHLQADVQKCFARKRVMLTTLTLWLSAIALGIILYLAVISS